MSLPKTPYLPRILDLLPTLERKSLFLLGPRQTGKSSYLKTNFPSALYIDLLLNENYSAYLKQPELLRKKIQLYFTEVSHPLIIIDEIQKIPALLNEVHYLIEENKSARFILTGSSARKLKSQNVNLLGGRAAMKTLYPFVYPEIKSNHADELKEILLTGCIPSISLSSHKHENLRDYVHLYLKEEVRLEGLVRDLVIFSDFLLLVAISCTEQINYSNFANDAQISVPTAKEYFQILEDTLIGIRLPPYKKTTKRKAVTSSKFYFFDVGLINTLLKRKDVSDLSPEFGTLVEQYVFQEIRAYIGYIDLGHEMYYWRTKDKTEVDFVISSDLNQLTAIEVKSSQQLKKKDFRGILRLEEEQQLAKKIIVTYKGHSYLEDNGIEVYNILDFLEKLWANKLIK